ncbi:MAG: 2-isopropylmalate synthase [Epulopiscium sp.]|jgi:2-isopropylmalate synthase|nr:2-isopropylmalate synthase [Defluviitalea raffinosedens]MBZ4668802.1 putative AIPM/Hcit synthase family transferase aq [Defluviitaleaceae bacterium]MDK2788785.1 2-isopropylmalate synthase [Candidatus Epulonipiscium sp.]
MKRMANKITIFDSTLRDGAQAEGISFSVEDKLKIVKTLDEFGVAYIEAGNPGSNPKDLEFFDRVKKIHLKNAKIAAFGSTRRRGISVEEDSNVQSLLTADTPVVVIFGKSWDFHVTDIIKTSLEENLEMIKETLRFFKEKGKEVIFDAEHFFDGYKANPDYAMAALAAAVEGGADCIVLCETNGGAFPDEVYEITKKVVETFKVPVGIHPHNDGGMAVANAIMAVKAGATHVQGTFIGFGERCGNVNLSTVIGNLQLKKKLECVPQEQMVNLTQTARRIAEIANVTLSDSMPYVGKSAFAHKGGMHIDGVSKASHSFEHVNPELVGNERRFLMSEVAGRSTILSKIQKVNPDVTKDSPETKLIIDRLKELEHLGYQFEGAESTFELIIRKQLGKYRPFFELDHFKIIGEHPAGNEDFSSSAMVKVKVDGKAEITAAEGDGPVNALDKALRKALEVFYPNLKDVHLTDYKVRVLDTKEATAAKVRVLIESTDGEDIWTTVGVSTDIIEASWIALVDSIEYKLIKDIEKKFKPYL